MGNGVLMLPAALGGGAAMTTFSISFSDFFCWAASKFYNKQGFIEPWFVHTLILYKSSQTAL